MPTLLINIDVPDLDAGIRFYTAAFGLTIGRRFGSGGVELEGGQAPIYLLCKDDASMPFDGAATGRDYARHWTPVHLDVVVDDLEAAIERAVAAGATVERGIAEQPWGRIAMLADPFGHGFCLLTFVGRGYDEIATPPRT